MKKAAAFEYWILSVFHLLSLFLLFLGRVHSLGGDNRKQIGRSRAKA